MPESRTYERWLDELGPCNNAISWARFITIANLIAFVCHICGLIAAAAVNNDDGDFSKPSIAIYMHTINFEVTGPGTESLSPIPSPAPGVGFELKPVLVDAGFSMSLRALAMSFFGVSAFFHLVLFLDGSWYQKFYFKWLNECIAPLRWVEYSISASIMMFTIAFAGGLKDIYLLTCVACLCFVTMCFGFVTEWLSRPDEDSRERFTIRDGVAVKSIENVALINTTGKVDWGRVQIPNANEDSELFFVGPATKWKTRSRTRRLLPHALGYVPYLTAYGIIIHSYVHNTADTNNGPPDWVTAVVFGQFALFTLFGLSQLMQQFSDNGCENYIYWEAVYILLSIVSKMVLGLMLIFQVFAYSTFEEAVSVLN